MLRELACFVLLVAGCSSQVASGVAPRKDSGADGLSSREDSGLDDVGSRKDSTADAAMPCSSLKFCCDDTGTYDVPEQCRAVAAGLDNTMCSLALASITYSNGEGRPAPGMPCGGFGYGHDGFPPPLGSCVTLADCCPSIGNTLEANTCLLIKTEAWNEPCTSALEKFRAMGLCSADGGTVDGSERRSCKGCLDRKERRRGHIRFPTGTSVRPG